MPEKPRVDARGVENVVALQATDNAIRMECLEADNAFNERAGLVDKQRTCRLVRPKTVECLRGSNGVQGIDRPFVELETMKGWSRLETAVMMVSVGDNFGPACAETTAPKENPGLRC